MLPFAAATVALAVGAPQIAGVSRTLPWVDDAVSEARRAVRAQRPDLLGSGDGGPPEPGLRRIAALFGPQLVRTVDPAIAEVLGIPDPTRGGSGVVLEPPAG